MRARSPLPGALVLLLLVGTPAVAKSPAAKKPVVRTRAEVEALIEKEGRKPPAWWKKTKLRYPKTLDLSWPPDPQGPWTPSKNVGQYIWSVINENPSRWKEGVRFLHHLLTVNKDSPDALERVMNALGNAYMRLHEDRARAAFWFRKAGKGQSVAIANCYWGLGCKEMAVEILDQIGADGTRHGVVMKLWSDMGEIDKALELAERRGGDVGFLVAGDACRLHGRYAEAIGFYDKVLALGGGGTGDLQRNTNRARASKEAVLLFDALDLSKVRSGKYKAQSLGYEAPIHVEVVVKRRKIRSVEVTRHREKQFHSALTDTPQRILLKQGVKGVDATSGATITSEAIINATAKALSQGLKKK